MQNSLLPATPAKGDLRDRRGMSTAAFITGAALWLLVLITIGMIYMRRQEKAKAMAEADAKAAAEASESTADAPSDSQEATPEKPDDAVVASTKTVRINFPTRPLPDFEFPECMGGTVSKENMKGKRWVANFVFTRCAGPCPTMTRDMSLLHKRVAKTAPDVQFVTFSVDSSYDTAEVLKKYAELFQADHARWKFVTGDEEQIHDFIRRGFALYVKANLGDMRKPGFEVAHSNRAVLVNEEGTPVASYLMNVPEDVVKLRRVIEGTDEFPKPGPLLTIEPSGENPDVGLTIVPAESTPEDKPAENKPPEDKPADDSKATDAPKEDSAPPSEPGAAPGSDKNEAAPKDTNSEQPTAEQTGNSVSRNALAAGERQKNTSKTPTTNAETPHSRPTKLAEGRKPSGNELINRTTREAALNATFSPVQSIVNSAALIATAQLRTNHLATLLTATMIDPQDAQSASDTTDAQKKTPSDSPESATNAAEGSADVSPQEQGLERNKAIDQKLPSWLALLPTINAGLNTLSTLLLLTGYSAIRSGKRDLHRNLMIVAFCVSVVFLACYLTYHEGLFRYTGQRGRAFTGPPTAKMIYLSILWPHIILAVFVPILAIRVFLHAFKQRWPEHKKLAKITFPIWLFVSITGVIIYAMLYHYPV
ncbi:MAG: DUF420 domain-containing protein [Planctomycetaceae bacterium]|nr:DUF420 domain-containing protein [Planctomycetaceae bacterium]